MKIKNHEQEKLIKIMERRIHEHEEMAISKK